MFSMPRTLATLFAVALLLVAPAAFAQIFDSGSDGSLGALEPTEDTDIQLPEDGVLNYTTVNIPAEVTVTFKPNASNTPVFLLASGDVIIEGVIDVSGRSGVAIGGNADLNHEGGAAGPGGSPGGAAGPSGSMWGNGPGGGSGNTGSNTGNGGASPVASGTTADCSGPSPGVKYAEAGWFLMHGGSGGGGSNWAAPWGGGGGGGGITIASSGDVLLSGQILAKGGDCKAVTTGGPGGAGFVRVAGNTITGNGTVNTSGGAPCWDASGWCSDTGYAGNGYVRFEGFDVSGELLDNAYPAPQIAIPILAVPYSGSARPQLDIVTVDAKQPFGPIGGWYPPNLSLPYETELEVYIEARHVPVGSQVKLIVNSQGKGRQVLEAGVLEGTKELSSVTTTMVVPDGTKLGTMMAYVPSMTFNP